MKVPTIASVAAGAVALLGVDAQLTIFTGLLSGKVKVVPNSEANHVPAFPGLNNYEYCSSLFLRKTCDNYLSGPNPSAVNYQQKCIDFMWMTNEEMTEFAKKLKYQSTMTCSSIIKAMYLSSALPDNQIAQYRQYLQGYGWGPELTRNTLRAKALEFMKLGYNFKLMTGKSMKAGAKMNGKPKQLKSSFAKTKTAGKGLKKPKVLKRVKTGNVKRQFKKPVQA